MLLSPCIPPLISPFSTLTPPRMKKLLHTYAQAHRCWRGAIAALATIVGTAGAAQAQVDTYQFAAAPGTFVQLPATATQLSAVQMDDAIAGVPLGFSFAFDGVPYDSAYVSSNGFISFNRAAGAASSNDLAVGWPSEQPLVAPLPVAPPTTRLPARLPTACSSWCGGTGRGTTTRGLP